MTPALVTDLLLHHHKELDGGSNTNYLVYHCNIYYNAHYLAGGHLLTEWDTRYKNVLFLTLPPTTISFQSAAISVVVVTSRGCRFFPLKFF
jgi:hypothetical protein